MNTIDRFGRVNLSLLGLFLAIIYWLIETILHTFYWETAPISVTFLAQCQDGELAMRLITVLILICFGYFAEHAKGSVIQLANSESKFRQLAYNLNAGLVIHNHDTSIAFLNKKASNLLGISTNEAIGKEVTSPAWCFVREDGSVMPVDEYPVNIVLSTKKSINKYMVGIHFPETNQTTWGMCNAFLSKSIEGKNRSLLLSLISQSAKNWMRKFIKVRKR